MYVLLATQRSGTNMLRSILATHPKIVTLPEVFRDDLLDKKDFGLEGFSYYEEYFLERVNGNPELALPKHRKANVEGYFEELSRLSQMQNLTSLVDIKFNSLHHAEGTWSSFGARPMMMDVIRSFKFPVIHLRRKSKLAVGISLLRAQATEQYVVDDDKDIRQVTFRVEPGELLYFLKAAEYQENKAGRWISDLGIKFLDLTYEELFVDGPGSDCAPEPFQRMAEFLGVDPGGIVLKPQTKRLAARSYREEIENFDEVEKALRNHIYHSEFVA